MTEAPETDTGSTRPDERHVDRRRCVRNCGSGLPRGYTDAWVETGLGSG